MMTNKMELCLQCGENYKPKRRGAQKFCSNSCRSRYWQLKQPKTNLQNSNNSLAKAPSTVMPPQEIEKISLAGVGNAALGVAAVDMVKHFFTPADNRPASKKDIAELKSIINGCRFFPVRNMDKDINGRIAYYDMETESVVYI